MFKGSHKMNDKDQDEQFSVSTLKGELRAALNETRRSYIPLFIAALAAFLSVFTLADHETDKLAMSAHIESTNQWARFQAKSIRRMDAQIASQMFEKLEKPDLAKYWAVKQRRYNNEKFDINNLARAQEKIRGTAQRQGDYFNVGVTLLQIAIVVASASLVMNGGLLFWLSIFITAIALVYNINGYGPFYEIPTNPAIIGDWLFGKFNELVHGVSG